MQNTQAVAFLLQHRLMLRTLDGNEGVVHSGAAQVERADALRQCP